MSPRAAWRTLIVNAPANFSPESSRSSLLRILDAQKAASLRQSVPTAERRIDWLDRCIGLLVDHQAEIADALNADFGARSKDATGLTDIAGSIGPLKYAKENLARWMRPEKRKTTPAILGLFGAKAEVRYQPKGVIGVISPWNFPVNLTFAPLAGVLAAGNRAMIKPSEFTPVTSELMKTMFAKAFSEDEIAVITGGPEVGQAFASLPFDHLVFTGATSVARHVMRAAAENLTPVTLELGGKSPVILSRGADMATAAARIMNGKTLNAGQICLAPDYVLAPADQVETFVAEARAAVARSFPTLKGQSRLHRRGRPAALRPDQGPCGRRPGQGRDDRRDQPGRRGFQPAGAPQDPADPDP
jgi:coniferyl-aldehyde dehydrogenase